ncbi:thioester reductase domain-containing protein [Sphaerisporangium sp. TRM90804]|uniref:thioester reductase domain-containing protein n=1 Tax=Sphaerisporangium sp. TRM90804 TaxID=3031113 RepID=UPI0024484999|nr:thioester reductase domain-containing protein [Sphaerisporangium sp. TRM90804]MDH2430805.1 thioester reductase domain-containing protein [Sphaerisporangium sp. TRM90804]
MRGLAQLHANGLAVDWAAVFAGTAAAQVDLPTYAFQRQKYWIDSVAPGSAEQAGPGPNSTGHPLLTSAVTLGGDQGAVLTGRLSPRTHPWLAGHTLGGTAFLPVSALVDLAVRAGDEVGCPLLAELEITAPLAVPEREAVQIQVVVGAPRDDGRRPVTVDARQATPPKATGRSGVSSGSGPVQDPPGSWVRHATGLLAESAPAPVFSLAAWPPPGAVPVELDGFYDGLAAHGHGCGPLFQGLRSLWRQGDELFAEVRLPGDADAAGFGLHPALLDAALHPLLPGAGPAATGVSWRQIALHATGASALRCRLTPEGPDAFRLRVADEAGEPVAEARSVTLRALPAEADTPADDLASGSLFRVAWSPAALPDAGDITGRWALLGETGGRLGAVAGLGLATLAEAAAAGDPVDALVVVAGRDPAAEGDVAGSARRATTRLLELVQDWLAGDWLTRPRLVVITGNAVGTHAGEDVDLTTAPLWGLVRAAQIEHPGGITLIDADDDPATTAVLPAAIESGHDQLAVRAGRASVPRLARLCRTPQGAPEPGTNGTAPPLLAGAPHPAMPHGNGGPAPAPHPDRTPPPLRTSASRFAGPRGIGGRALDPDGTVLVTGGTGSLGALFARHLVTEYGVRRLVLTSRRGGDSPGAADLREELTGLGARVEIVAGDVADRATVAALLAGIPAAHPLTGVVHTAGVIDDGIITSLTPGRLASVLAPKVDAALHLHELTADLDLAMFVLFSSVAGIIGSPGQANYSAANLFLDALAHHRRGRGLPAVSIAWGAWAQTHGMAARLTEADWNRATQAGLRPISPDEGPALFDAALAADDAVPVPMHLNLDVVTRQHGPVPPLLRGLIRKPVRRIVTSADGGGALADRLTALDPAEQRALLLGLVRTAVAAVLGHGTTEDVADDAVFTDLGFDSLTAVELRNRLTSETGLALPPTVVFDHTTPAALADHLRAEVLAGAAPADSAPSRFDFDAEIRLAADVVPAAEVTTELGDPAHVLLTGATGFLGAFLLRDLMRSTRATVHCLVRGADERTALERLRANLAWYGLLDEVDVRRLAIVLGDLAEPRFGLAPAAYDALARIVDGVYHAGATVNWLHPYRSLKASNVTGTEEVLRLAALHRTVPVHHISSTGVFAGPAADGAGLAPEDPIGPPDALTNGYRQSKYVTEKIIELARERGLPVSVYRVDVVSGDQRTGACQTQDFVWLSLKGCLQAGALPKGADAFFPMVPVDYVSAAVTRLSQARAAGGTFHLGNRTPVAFQDMVAYLRDSGYAVAETSWDDFVATVKADRGNALFPVIDIFRDYLTAGEAVYMAIDAGSTERALAGSGIGCPPIDRDLFGRYARFFAEAGYFPGRPALADAGS